MNTQKKDGRREKAKSNTFGPMGHEMSEMMIKCCTDRGGFPDRLTMMEEMKKQCCAQNVDIAESERKKK